MLAQLIAIGKLKVIEPTEHVIFTCFEKAVDQLLAVDCEVDGIAVF